MSSIVIVVGLAVVIFIMLLPGRKEWNRYTAFAKLRPDEVVLFQERRVRVISEMTGEPFWVGWNWVRVNVKITNYRILETIYRNIPAGVINYARHEEGIRPIFLWPTYFFNVTHNDLSFSVGRKGRRYLQVVHKWPDGSRIVKKYFFKDIGAVKDIFHNKSAGKTA